MTDDDVWIEPEKLLNDWLRRARESQHSHHESGKSCMRFHYWIGVPAAVLAGLLGSAAFVSLQKAAVSDRAKIGFGAFSLLAAVLATLQTVLKFSERSERHKVLGATYGNIRREIETVLALPPSMRGAPKSVLDTMRSKLDKISAEGPVVPTRIFNRTLSMLRAKDKAKNQ